jgi:hypothetical protein|tara:strand:- start:6081 stop:6410 length:330 start_codon:yes stop_codon:yes gene_type:complete
MNKFNLHKLWIATKELVETTSIPRSSLYRYVEEWVKKGNDPKDMGRIKLRGSKSYRWDARVFVGWIIKHKLEEPIKFDYEFAENEHLKQILVFNKLPLNKQQLRKEQTL